MKQEGLLFFDDIYLMAIAFLLFFVSFLFIGYNTFRKGNKKFYEKMAELPLGSANQSKGEKQ